MDYRPGPLIIVLFGLVFLFDAASVCLYTVILSRTARDVASRFEVMHLTMTSLAILMIIAFVIYYLCTHRRHERPIWMLNISMFTFLFVVNLIVAISVSIKAATRLCEDFSSIDPLEHCTWGGVSIILPWIASVFSAGGLIATIAQNHFQPIEDLKRKSQREREDWLKSCESEIFKASNHKTVVLDLGSIDALTASDSYVIGDKPANLRPETEYEPCGDQVTLSRPDAITTFGGFVPSEESLETSKEPLHEIEVDSGQRYEAPAILQPTFGFPEESVIIDKSGVDSEGVDADCDSDVLPPVRKKRQARARRLKSDAIRPAKAFVIRFKEPVAVPVRDEPAVVTSDLLSTPQQ